MNETKLPEKAKPPEKAVEPTERKIVERRIAPADMIFHEGGMFQGASTLKLTADEKNKLMRDPSPDDIEIKPATNLIIFLPGAWYRQLLSETFGPCEWSFLLTDQPRADTTTRAMYVEGILLVRGHFIGQGWGECELKYDAMGWTDMIAAAETEALHRAMKNLGGGFIKLWQPKFIEEFKKKYCIKVKVKTFKGPRLYWRRKDRDPLDGETETVLDPQAIKPENGKKDIEPTGTPQPINQTPFGLTGAHWTNILAAASKHGIGEEYLVGELKAHYATEDLASSKKSYAEVVKAAETICKRDKKQKELL